MSYEYVIKTMLSRGLIKKQKIDFSQIEALLYRARKDLKVAIYNLEEAKNALRTAEEFVNRTIEWVKMDNPQLRLDID